MVAGDHDHAHAGGVRLGHGLLDLGTNRVDHAAEAEEGHVVLERLGREVRGRGLAVVHAGGSHHAKRVVGHGLVGLHDALAPLVREGHVALGGVHLGAAGENDVGAALGVLDVVAVGRLVDDGHHLAAGVEGRLAHAGVGGVEVAGGEAELGCVCHERGLRGLAHGVVAGGVPLGVGAECHAANETALVLGEVAHDRHLVLREGARLVRADDLRAAKGLHGGELADNGVVLAHLGDADGEHDGHHGRQSLGDGRDGKRHGDHERVEHERHVLEEAHAVLEPGDREDQRADHDAYDGEDLGELVELLLERGLLVLGTREGVGDLAHLGVHARGNHDGAATTIDHGGAHVAHVLAVAERDVLALFEHVEDRGDLVDRHGLAGEGGLLDLHGGALDDAAVRRHRVAGLEDHEVANNKLGGRDAHNVAAAHDLALGGRHLLERRQRLLGLGLLDHAENRVHHDDEADDDHVREVRLALRQPREGRDDRGNDEHDDHRVCHLCEEALPERVLLGLLELVETVFLETCSRLLWGKAIGVVRRNVLDDLRRLLQVLLQFFLLGSWAPSRLMPDHNSPEGQGLTKAAMPDAWLVPTHFTREGARQTPADALTILVRQPPRISFVRTCPRMPHGICPMR